jgi:ribonuclease I
LNFTRRKIYNVNKRCPRFFLLNFTDDTKKDVSDKYDYYIYSLTYGPTFCKQKPNSTECYKKLKSKKNNRFIIHGLWPSYKNGIIPQDCNIGEDIQIEFEKTNKFLNNISEYWYSLNPNDSKFWSHEYNVHGFCYNKRNNITVNDYEVFFLKAISIYEKYDLKNIFYNMFNNQLDKGDRKITAKEVEDYFAKIGIEKGSYYLICNFINIDSKIVPYIGEIRIRFDLDFNLYKSESDKVDYECPSEFWVEFL